MLTTSVGVWTIFAIDCESEVGECAYRKIGRNKFELLYSKDEDHAHLLLEGVSADKVSHTEEFLNTFRPCTSIEGGVYCENKNLFIEIDLSK